MSRSGLATTAIGASLLVSPSTSGGQVPVFPAEVELVTVDVIVRDEKGGALRGLASDDFVLTEDGKPQTIVSFEAVDRSGALEEMDERPSPVATNEGAAEDRSGAFVLLVDDLGLDATRLPRLLKALPGVLETALSDGDEVTLSTASGSLWWTLRFPEGREDLSVLLGKVKGRKVPEASVEPMSDYEAHQIANLERAPVVPNQASFPPYLDRLVRRLMGTSVCPGPRADLCAHLVQAHAAEQDTERKARTRALMATVERAIFSLSGVRGRKELLLFSAGFITDVGEHEVRQVAGICREANVVVNFLDARGALLRLVEESAAIVGNPPDLRERGGASFEQRQDEIGGSLDLAQDTGGLAVTGTDDFAASTRRILDESRTYYLLGYQPPPGKGPRDWRKVKVEVRRPGTRVRSRKGYTLRSAGAAEGALFTSGGKKEYEKGHEPEGPPARGLDLDRALLNTQVSRGLPLRALPYVFDEGSAGRVRVRLAVEVDERALFSGAPKDGAEAALRVVVQAAHRDSGEVFRDDKRYAVSVPSSRAPAWATFYHELDILPGVVQVRVVVSEEASGRIGAVTARVQIPAADGLRLATPILADELRELPKEGVLPRLVVPAHRVFSNMTPTLYCQIQVLGAVPSPTGVPEVQESHVLRRASGPEVARSTPSLIAAAPGGPVGRLFGLSLATLPEGDYELVLHAVDRTNGGTTERVEAFRVEGDAPRTVAEAPEPSAPASAPTPGPRPAEDAPRSDPRSRPAARPPALEEILRSAGEYVVAYEALASGVVLEEAYNQSLRSGPASGTSRMLQSEFVLVSLPGEVGVMGFRDVFKVDGRQVRDRDQRLEKLFLSPGAAGVAQARAVLDESARYNLGATRRNFNLPTIALAVLRPEFQPRFAFRDEGTKKRRGRVVREIEYEELTKPTLIRDPVKDRDYFARGRFLIVPETGAVLHSEMRFDHEGGRTEVAVDYAWNAALELWLPATMSEQDDNRIRGPRLPGAPADWGGETMAARAEYRKPRRFGVTTEEKFRPEE